MALDAIFGGALGALARLAPEALKFFDRKNERKHELALGTQQLDLVKYQGDNKLRTEQVTADSAQMVAGLDAIKAAYASMKTGVPFIDGLNQLVRPWITFVVFHTWLFIKIAAFVTLSNGGIDWNIAAASMWTPDDTSLLSGITTFYFLGRVFDKKAR
jgi:hypothetical protein